MYLPKPSEYHGGGHEVRDPERLRVVVLQDVERRHARLHGRGISQGEPDVVLHDADLV